MTYTAKDPAGKVHTYKGKRAVAYAIFFPGKDGSYYPHFAKTIEAARRHWGADAKGLTRAIKS